MTGPTALRVLIREVLTKSEMSVEAGAGFVVFRKFPDGLKVLVMLLNLQADLPKGCIDISDRDILSAAQRELREETGLINVSMPWGHEGLAAGSLYAFMGMTDEDPVIAQNPVTGVKEHDSFLWVSAAGASDLFDGDMELIVRQAVAKANTYIR